MKQIHLIIIFLIAATQVLPASAQDLEAEIIALADSLSKQIKESGKKRVTVVDLADLQGNFNELGRFVGEQLTVNMLKHSKDFKMVNRANLERILAEHKLSMSGLLKVENAKKLGQISGVDAIIIGSLTPFKPTVQITVQIVDTDTAELIGGGTGKIVKTKDIEELLERSVNVVAKTNPPSGRPEQEPPVPKLAVEKNSQRIGNLLIKVESLKVVNPNNWESANLTLSIANVSKTETVGIALDSDIYQTVTLSNSRSDVFKTADVFGITKAYVRDGRYFGELTDIEAGGIIKVTIKSQLVPSSNTKDYRPYRLQAVFIWGLESNGRHPKTKAENVVIDIE